MEKLPCEDAAEIVVAAAETPEERKRRLAYARRAKWYLTNGKAYYEAYWKLHGKPVLTEEAKARYAVAKKAWGVEQRRLAKLGKLAIAAGLELPI